MSKWVDIGPASNFEQGVKQCITVEDHALVVMKVEGAFYTIANVCPHAGMPLGDGDLAGKVITCPYHGYTYNVATGQNIDFPDTDPPVQTFATRITDDGRVEVDLDIE